MCYLALTHISQRCLVNTFSPASSPSISAVVPLPPDFSCTRSVCRTEVDGPCFFIFSLHCSQECPPGQFLHWTCLILQTVWIALYVPDSYMLNMDDSWRTDRLMTRLTVMGEYRNWWINMWQTCKCNVDNVVWLTTAQYADAECVNVCERERKSTLPKRESNKGLLCHPKIKYPT